MVFAQVATVATTAVAQIFAYVSFALNRTKRRKKNCSAPIIIVISLRMPSFILRVDFILLPNDIIHVLYSPFSAHRIYFHVRRCRRRHRHLLAVIVVAVVGSLGACICKDQKHAQAQRCAAKKRNEKVERKKDGEKSRTTGLIWFVEFFV